MRHCSMKLLGQADQLGLASPLKYAAIQSAKTKGPSSRQAGLDASDQPRVPFEGHGEEFFLDILFNRTSEIDCNISCAPVSVVRYPDG